MKPTANCLHLLGKFVREGLCFALELTEALTLAEGTKLASVVAQFEPLKGSLHLWVLATHHDCIHDDVYGDGIFPYEDATKVISIFLKKLFSSGLDHHVIDAKLSNCHALSVAVSFHDGDQMTDFKIISSVLFQELPDNQGFYIPYLGTTTDRFHFKGGYGDQRPWRRRGFTSMLLHILQTVCQLHCNATSIFLECREILVPTYTKLGFSRCDSIEKSWDVPQHMSVEPSSELVRMWIGSRIVATAAISGTASLCQSRPFRSCCRDLAFGQVQATQLFDLDVFLFEYIDSFEHRDKGFIARCTMCADTSESFSQSTFTVRYYEYAYAHLKRCPRLRRDNRRRTTVDRMYMSTKDALVRHDEDAEARLASRSSWLSRYCVAVAESSCIPGCGLPCDPKSKGYERLLLTLPTRYSIRLARKAPSITVGTIKSADCVITHLQYSTSGQFIGYNLSGTAYILEEDFVKTEFHKYFILYVKNLCPRKLGVPVGASSGRCTPLATNVQLGCNANRVTQQLHRDTCVFSSALSAFKYFGDFKAVTCLRNRLFASTTKPDRLGFLIRTLQHGSLNYQPKLFRQRKLDVLTDLSPFPTVIKLCGKDGQCFHVVTVVGRVLFDSNCTEPLPLCRSALDWCCSYNSGERSEFAFVMKAYRFIHNKPKVYWRLTF